MRHIPMDPEVTARPATVLSRKALLQQYTLSLQELVRRHAGALSPEQRHAWLVRKQTELIGLIGGAQVSHRALKAFLRRAITEAMGLGR